MTSTWCPEFDFRPQFPAPTTPFALSLSLLEPKTFPKNKQTKETFTKTTFYRHFPTDPTRVPKVATFKEQNLTVTPPAASLSARLSVFDPAQSFCRRHLPSEPLLPVLIPSWTNPAVRPTRPVPGTGVKGKICNTGFCYSLAMCRFPL